MFNWFFVGILGIHVIMQYQIKIQAEFNILDETDKLS